MNQEDLNEWYITSNDIINTIDQLDLSIYNTLMINTLTELRTKCMQNVILIALLNNVHEKYPAAKFESSLWTEGVDSNKLFEGQDYGLKDSAN